MDDWTGAKSLLVGYVTSGLLLLKLIIGLPLNFMVVFYSFQTFKYTKDYVPVGGFANKIMRLSVVAITILIGCLHGLMLLIAAFTLTFGTYASLMDIVQGS